MVDPLTLPSIFAHLFYSAGSTMEEAQEKAVEVALKALQEESSDFEIVLDQVSD